MITWLRCWLRTDKIETKLRFSGLIHRIEDELLLETWLGLELGLSLGQTCVTYLCSTSGRIVGTIYLSTSVTKLRLPWL